jgi:PleD family two-component response regulator
MSDILFADDDADLRWMVVDVLQAAGHQVRLARDGTEALAEVRRQPPELLILDYRMGEPDGFAVCRTVKDDPRTAHLPVLILTAQSGTDDRLRGFDAGADDYLPKPFDPRELVARAAALLRQAKRGRDRNPTSGLPGGDAIREEVDRRVAQGEAFALCYFDLDDFKPFSDTFGFATADEAIREAGRAVTHVAGATESFVGHVGGDDFVLVCDVADGARLAAEARAHFDAGLRRHLPAEASSGGTYRGRGRDGVEREFPLTRLSAAVVSVDPAKWQSLEALGRRVADAKRRAKAPGSGGIVEITL